MSDLMKNIDGRTKLAGTNKLEILLFTLGTDSRSGRRETYGINVFKVREVMRVPEITRPPELPPSVEGMVSSARTISAHRRPGQIRRGPNRSQTRGHDRDRIQRPHARLSGRERWIPFCAWIGLRSACRPICFPRTMGGLVTAVTELPDNRLVMLMDVEKMLAETTGDVDDELIFSQVKPVPLPRSHHLFL